MKTNNIEPVIFDSVSDLVQHAETPKPEDADNESRDGSIRDSWSLGVSYEQTLEMAGHGWPEGLSNLESDLEGFNMANRGTARSGAWIQDVRGSLPNVPAYLAGSPTCMHRRVKRPRNRPVMRLYIPVNYLCDVDARNAVKRGAAALAICDALESDGVRVELVACTFNRVIRGSVEHSFSINTLIKRAGEPIHLGELVFPLVHPTFFRRLLFAAYERHPSAHVRWATVMAGYGQ